MRLGKAKKASLVTGSALLAFSLLFLGIKFGILFHFGSAIPFWDQWDAEAANLYKPFLEGTLTWHQLLVPHNEHRILTTRLLALLLLKSNGLWNPLLQMTVNAVLHLMALLIMLVLLVHILGKKTFFPLLLFFFFFFSIPFGWENTLVGFQSQFYFVLIFALLTLFFIIEREPFSPCWWVGIFCGVLAFFSLASGIFAFTAGAAVLGIQFLQGTARSLRYAAALLLLGVLMLVGILMTPTVLGHAPLKAHSIGHYISIFSAMMSWPMRGNLFWFLFRNIPAVIFCVSFFLQRPLRNDHRWLLLGLVIWSTIQIMSIAYGRAVGCMSSRYIDLFAFSVCINFACLLEKCSWNQGRIRFLALLVWTVVIFCGSFACAHKTCYQQLAEKRHYSTIEMLNVQRYQASNDIGDLQNKKFLEIPYPDPNRLALILSYPTIQQILPACIHKSSEDGTVVKGRYDAAVDVLLAHYFVLIEAGTLILLLLTIGVLFC